MLRFLMVLRRNITSHSHQLYLNFTETNLGSGLRDIWGRRERMQWWTILLKRRGVLRKRCRLLL